MHVAVLHTYLGIVYSVTTWCPGQFLKDVLYQKHI